MWGVGGGPSKFGVGPPKVNWPRVSKPGGKWGTRDIWFGLWGGGEFMGSRGVVERVFRADVGDMVGPPVVATKGGMGVAELGCP